MNDPDKQQKIAAGAHRIELPGERWALWRWVGLRGAGFSAARVLQLNDPEAASAADDLLDAEQQAQQALADALAAIHTALDGLRAAGSWDNPGQRQPLLNALRGLKKGQFPSPDSLPAAVAAVMTAARAAGQKRDALRGRFEQTFGAATQRASQAIYTLATDERFREALVWQNRHAFHTGVAALQPPQAGTPRSSKQRQHEELVANYTQRYSVKNDTIGFFGPVGWATLVPHGPAIAVRPGNSLLRSRSVYFEQWAIDLLAEKLAQDPWLRPWLSPRQLPFSHLDGTTLYRLSKRPAAISPAQAAVLQACTGQHTARSIAAELRRSYPLQIKSEAEVYKLLEQFCNLGLIVWTLEIPFATHPERSLRRALEQIDDQRLVQPLLAALDELDRLRDAVARAAGDARQVDQALESLEATFTRITGTAATRNPGATYAARTLVYEDTQRDLELQIGPELLQELGPPLSLLLTSARWITYEAAATYRRAFAEIYADLVSQTGNHNVEMVSFWQQVQIRLLGEHPRPSARVIQAFQERWAEVLALPEDARQVAYTSAALQPLVAALFSAPRPGWQSARYQSPDLMIASDSPEAICRGAYQFVMGELHLSSNTLQASFFIEQHPAQAELFQAVENDLPDPRVVPITPRTWPEMSARTRPGFVGARDARLAFTNDACGVSPGQVLPIGRLIVSDTGSGLAVSTRDHRQQFDIIEFFADILALEIVDAFKIFGRRRHTPRVTVDRLVIARETWRFAPETLPFAGLKAESERFLAVRRWRRAQDLPRAVFVKTPVERKPFYVDFDSPVLVNLLAKMVRRTLEQGGADSLITVTEMLPALDQLWLPDATGQRYTSELRIIAVDQAGSAAPEPDS